MSEMLASKRVKASKIKGKELTKEDIESLNESDYEYSVADPGVDDKRLLCTESEFASILKVLERNANTLSAVIRSAFDHGSFHSLTKNDSITATDAHVSISGHIVQQELNHYLNETEAANGFGNRFLWFCVRRSKFLPNGGQPDTERMRILKCKIDDIINYVQERGEDFELRRDEQADALWEQSYQWLSRAIPGLLGSMTARAEAHVTRLSMLYALLDMSDVIRPEHLSAALEVWRYSFDSSRLLFGSGVGNARADEILAHISSNRSGVSKTEIRDHFGRYKAKENDVALNLLEEFDLIESVTQKTKGRPRQVWILKRATEAT